VVSGLFAILSLATALFAIHQGNTNLILKTEERTPFKVEARDEDSVTLVSTMDFVNKGKQCATVTDCLARTQLPYEQYDGNHECNDDIDDGNNRLEFCVRSWIVFACYFAL